MTFRKNIAAALFLSATMPAGLLAQTFTTLVTFDGSNGGNPYGALVAGNDGNFYGTTQNGDGTVFLMNPSGSLTTLHAFTKTDGSQPFAGLTLSADGSFYGTTSAGGAAGLGTVFKMASNGGAAVLHSFNGSDGANPMGGLTTGSDGNFYGVTQAGGTSLMGTVFKITPAGALTTLHAFNTADGAGPYGGLIQAADGNFYGTTQNGGANGKGTVFAITPAGTLTTLYSFCAQTGCADGATPYAGLIQATDRNFYGTTQSGGANGGGSIFKITSTGALTTLHSFSGMDGAAPLGALFQAADGNFYGATSSGGAGILCAHGCGTVFKMTPAGTLTTLHSFSGADGSNPNGALAQGSSSVLYGTTASGVGTGQGTVFSLDAGLASPLITAVVSGASFAPGIVPNSWATIQGSGLTTNIDTWDGSVIGGKFPTMLDGVTVTIGGQPAYLNYISPSQINILVPDIGPGPQQVMVMNSLSASATFNAVSSQYAPAFFSWPGKQIVATRQDFSVAVKDGTFPSGTTVAAKPGEVIILWGTGFGPTTPVAPSGVVVPSDRTYSTTTIPTITINDVPATVYGAALSPGLAGTYQIAIQVPDSLGNGDWPVVASIGGAQSPGGLILSVQQ